MKAMAISLFIILAIPLASAIEFTLNSPEEVKAEAEFIISIALDEGSSTTFDVKAFVHEPVKAYSEIFDRDKWASPHFYLRGVFPTTTEFKLLPHFIGETNVCVRLRETGKSSFTEKCNPLEVLPSEIQEGNSENNNREESSSSNEDSGTSNSLQPVPQNNSSNSISLSKKQNDKKIVLSSKPNSQKLESETIITNQEKIRRGIIYGFLIFLVAIIILLALRKL